MADTSIAPAAVTSRPAYNHFQPSDLPQSWFYDEWDVRRGECPVSHSSEHGGFFLLTRYEDCFNTLADTETFTSSQSVAIPPQPFKFVPEDIDPPEHRKYRKLINAALAPQKMADYEPSVRADVVSILDGLAGRREIDVVRDFAGPFPRAVALRLIGLPTEDLGRISEWTEILTYTPRESAEAEQAGVELFTYLGGLVVSRKELPPTDDLLSLIVHGDLDGSPIGVEDAMSYLALLLFGGLHTTTHAIAGWLLYLSSHPDARAQLESDPSVWNRAIDEALRWTSPSSHLGRVATKDTVIGGCPIPAGSRVMVSIGAANQDPEQFSNPREMTLDRTPNAHAAFGFGPHRCVGSHLAKLQMRVALEEWLARYSDFALADPNALRYQGAEVRGLVKMPFTVTAR